MVAPALFGESARLSLRVCAKVNAEEGKPRRTAQRCAKRCPPPQRGMFSQGRRQQMQAGAGGSMKFRQQARCAPQKRGRRRCHSR